MLQRFEIAGVHFDIDESLRKYVTTKLAHLDRYIPKHSRSSAHLEVRLQEKKASGRRLAVCEVTLHLPHETISLTETAITMYAAVDVIKTKLKQQIQKYKDELMNGKQRRHIFARLRRKFALSTIGFSS